MQRFIYKRCLKMCFRCIHLTLSSLISVVWCFACTGIPEIFDFWQFSSTSTLEFIVFIPHNNHAFSEPWMPTSYHQRTVLKFNVLECRKVADFILQGNIGASGLHCAHVFGERTSFYILSNDEKLEFFYWSLKWAQNLISKALKWLTYRKTHRVTSGVSPRTK